MPPSTLPSRVWHRVCGPQMLAADAAIIGCPGDRVLTAARAVRTLAGLDAHRPPRIARRCLPCTPPAVGVPRREPPRDASSGLRGRRSLRGWTPRRTPGWLAALRFVSGGPHASSLPIGLRSRHHRAAGAAPALGPRLDAAGLPDAAATRLGAGAPSRQHRRLPVLPTTSGWRPLAPSPAFPREGASRPLPSALLARKPGKHRTRRASDGAPPRVKAKPSRGGRWPAWTRRLTSSQLLL